MKTGCAMGARLRAEERSSARSSFLSCLALSVNTRRSIFRLSGLHQNRLRAEDQEPGEIDDSMHRQHAREGAWARCSVRYGRAESSNAEQHCEDGHAGIKPFPCVVSPLLDSGCGYGSLHEPTSSDGQVDFPRLEAVIDRNHWIESSPAGL